MDSVKLLFPAGSAVPSSCEQKIRKKFRNLQGVCNGYGQTESGIVSIGFENGNLGMIMPQFKVKIQDPNTGKLQTVKIEAFIFHHIEKAYLAFLS